MKTKEMMSKILNSYIEDLREGRKPQALEMFKENPELAKTMAPLIHIARLSMIREGAMKTTEMDPEKSKELSDNLIRKIKGLKNNEQKERPSIGNMRSALAFRKNDEEIEEEEKDYTSEAIDRLMEKIDKKNNNK